MPFRYLILVGLVFLGFAQALIYYPQMPTPMASHFDGAGIPNGWSTPAQFFGLAITVELLSAGCFLIGRLVGRMPTSMINLPNKEYWLAPERREQTMRRFSDSMIDFGIITHALLLYAFQLCILANLNPPPRLSHGIVWALILYAVLTVAWTIRMLTSYRVPRSS
jgi:uncharacterized membrane protein